MEIAKKGIQIMHELLASNVQDPAVAFVFMIVIGVMLIAKGGEIKKF